MASLFTNLDASPRMRTFHNLDLLNSVAENPFGTIGQRDYRLYLCYGGAYNMYTELNYHKGLEDAIRDMPSIEEYVAAQMGEEHNRTVRFDFYIGWESEDARHHFDLCMEKIREYEIRYPIHRNTYSFELRSDLPELDLRIHLKHMILRPRMYGINGLAGLRAYLDGYFRFKNEHQLNLSEYESALSLFIENWKTKVDKRHPFETWDRPLRLEQIGTTDFSGTFSQREFDRFEEILQKELKMDLVDWRHEKPLD